MDNLEKLCAEVVKISREAGAFIRSQVQVVTPDNVEYKGIHDFVTYVDKTSEKMLVEKLSVLLPDSGFLVEEKSVEHTNKELYWIIDPLDGTTNFLHGLSPFAVSIALMEKDEVILAVVYEVTQDECFYTWQGGAAYLNGKVIRVTERDKFSDSLIATGFPYYDYERIHPFLKTLEYFFNNTHGVRRLGSAATDLAYVACGRFEAFYEYSLHPWDVAAGVLLVKNAGGKVCDFSGKDDYIFGQELIASNAGIYDELLKVIKSIMVDK
ncbi:MAG: inositol monophosphatase [Bacteroidetes bacterium HGW-Bacteroidetes-21]|nr:MAG: inositol monophosphatase [Bacteroidetes bacterium HGW-Bacteroidetes-21]